MTRGRHSLQPRASRFHRAALIAAPLLTCTLVGVGVAGTRSIPTTVDFSASEVSSTAAAGALPPAADRGVSLSRSSQRRTVVPPRPKTVVKDRVKALATVAARVAGGLADQPCPATSGTEFRLTPEAVRVYRAVCNAFPQITRYGGYAPRGEHSSGKAIDIMTTDLALGDAIAAFLQAHAAELDLYDIIWQQRIWTPVRAAEGWRPMPDRGSPTANHRDHVHVSVN